MLLCAVVRPRGDRDGKVGLSPVVERYINQKTSVNCLLGSHLLVSCTDSAEPEGDAAPTTPQAARGEAFSGVSPHDLSCNNDEDESSSGDDSSRASLHADDNVKYSTLDSDGENDEGTGWGDDELTGDRETCVNLDEDGPAQPKLRYDSASLPTQHLSRRLASAAVTLALLALAQHLAPATQLVISATHLLVPVIQQSARRLAPVSEHLCLPLPAAN
ncbi:unnamed protein product [Phytophthora fragariaefolia]|uniref:Unnamed protein product n=1 Tax=Phytophthora fragariaefolia TaxID=1490495 RepID=A0A9W7D8P9_9STRA|nr:unnamed protein product [Phytophthora fragariaefolia]